MSAVRSYIVSETCRVIVLAESPEGAIQIGRKAFDDKDTRVDGVLSPVQSVRIEVLNKATGELE